MNTEDPTDEEIREYFATPDERGSVALSYLQRCPPARLRRMAELAGGAFVAWLLEKRMRANR